MTEELKKLNPEERAEFLQLYHTPPHELSESDSTRYEQLSSRINVARYAFEVRRQKLREPHLETLIIKEQSPTYKLETVYGNFTLPSNLVPSELEQLPDKEKFFSDTFTALVSMDLEAQTFTALTFLKYLQKPTTEQLNEIVGNI